MTYFKKILAIVILTLSFVKSNAQTKFDNGYKDGFGKAYCYNQSIGCIPKAPTFAPIPRISESSSSYQNGYDRGYSEGLEYRRNERQLNEVNLQKNSARSFNPYISQIPVDAYREVGMYKQKLFNEREGWIQNRVSELIELNKELDDYDSKLRAEWSIPLANWITKNEAKNLDLLDNYVFNQISTYLNDYTNKFLVDFNRVKEEIKNNEINFDDKYYKNIPDSSKVCRIYFNKLERTDYEMWQGGKDDEFKYVIIDKYIPPSFINKFTFIIDGKIDTLFVLYFKKYDSYHFYKSSYMFPIEELGAFKDHPNYMVYTVTKEYTQGGYGNPIYIKLSETNCLLYDKGKALNCNFMGEIHYKINKYHNGNFKETYYDKKLCWQDKVSGKKYFLNSKSISDIPTCSDNLLVTNNKF